MAFPILRSNGVRAVFFLSTACIGTGKLPWWDIIAYTLKQSVKKRISLKYPEPAVFDLARDGAKQVCMQILRVFAHPAEKDPERVLADLERECEVSRPEAGARRCFLTWAKPGTCSSRVWHSALIPIAMKL
jgi:hypothetical protein